MEDERLPRCRAVVSLLAVAAVAVEEFSKTLLEAGLQLLGPQNSLSAHVCRSILLNRVFDQSGFLGCLVSSLRLQIIVLRPQAL